MKVSLLTVEPLRRAHEEPRRGLVTARLLTVAESCDSSPLPNIPGRAVRC